MPLLTCNLGMCIEQGQIFFAELTDERPQKLPLMSGEDCTSNYLAVLCLQSNGEYEAGCRLLRQFFIWLKAKK